MQDRHRRSYEIRIHGDGTVEYRSALDPDARHLRIISTDDVIALANQFIAAGFLDASEHYDGKIEEIRNRDGVLLQHSSGSGSEAATTRLILRVGYREKEVTLVDSYPEALGKLTELVDRLGGPQVWTAR